MRSAIRAAASAICSRRGSHPVHVLNGLRGRAEPIRLVEMTQPCPSLLELADACAQLDLDVVDLLCCSVGIDIHICRGCEPRGRLRGRR